MKRTAIILDRNLNRGQASSLAAILMGQASLCDLELYGEHRLLDSQGLQHAAVRYTTIVLKARRKQLLDLARAIQDDHQELVCIVFSQFGQSLPDAFDYYCEIVSESPTDQLEPLGVLVTGDAMKVREITKRFSLLD